MDLHNTVPDQIYVFLMKHHVYIPNLRSSTLSRYKYLKSYNYLSMKIETSSTLCIITMTVPCTGAMIYRIQCFLMMVKILNLLHSESKTYIIYDNYF